MQSRFLSRSRQLAFGLLVQHATHPLGDFFVTSIRSTETQCTGCVSEAIIRGSIFRLGILGDCVGMRKRADPWMLKEHGIRVPLAWNLVQARFDEITCYG